jgi:hypothetical protein
MPQAITCPQCNGPITPHRFARAIVCPYCGNTVELDETSVSVETFHESFQAWNDPASYGISSRVSLGEKHWALDKHLAQGSISDVYAGRRARWPTELVVLKVLRDPEDRALFDNEWAAIQSLQKSSAQGAHVFTRLMPQPVAHGTCSGGDFAGRRVTIFRWASGFYHTFEDVRGAYPDGIPPRASIWVWRRILEMLTFIHNSGMAHGAILPAHLLVQRGEHGVRLVGYSRAGKQGDTLRPVSPDDKAFYPASWSKLSPQLDLVMSARSIAYVLGGDPTMASLPAAVPAALADVIRRVALAESNGLSMDAWALREELGTLSRQVFGAPQFCPIEMTS